MLRDVKIYFQKTQAQYLQAKEDLKEFEQAFKDGKITEDRVQVVKDELELIESNYRRVAFILHLFNLPKKESYRSKYKNNNKALNEYFNETGSSDTAVIKENEDALKELKAELKKLTKKE